MLTITTDIKGNKYEALIEYAYLRCDAFSFRLPRLSDFSSYRERVKPVLDKFMPYMTNRYTGTDYFWSTNVEADIYVVNLAEELKCELLSQSRLFDWQYPDAPEDLCFISNGKCWLSCIAHEELCFIYTDNAFEKNIIKKMIGLKYTERSDVETPRLK